MTGCGLSILGNVDVSGSADSSDGPGVGRVVLHLLEKDELDEGGEEVGDDAEGADDEGEMGVFHDLYQPQREANLRVRLEEYLRFGLEAGIFYTS